MSMYKLATPLLISFLLLAVPVQADIADDFQQQILVEAENQVLDLEANRLTFRNNVRISQGSLLISADLLVVESQSADPGDGELFIASGQPANYRQEIKPGVVVRARAREIRYDEQQRVLTLAGDAEMEQSGNTVQADVIRYEILAQRVVAERGEDSERRVTTIFQPNRDTEENNNNEPRP